MGVGCCPRRFSSHGGERDLHAARPREAYACLPGHAPQLDRGRCPKPRCARTMEGVDGHRRCWTPKPPRRWSDGLTRIATESSGACSRRPHRLRLRPLYWKAPRVPNATTEVKGRHLSACGTLQRPVVELRCTAPLHRLASRRACREAGAQLRHEEAGDSATNSPARAQHGACTHAALVDQPDTVSTADARHVGVDAAPSLQQTTAALRERAEGLFDLVHAFVSALLMTSSSARSAALRSG